MAIASESAKYISKNIHADNLLFFAADMGWLTTSGRNILASELTKGIHSLSSFPSVVLHYPRLDEVIYQAEDIDGFLTALQEASDAYSLDCILSFAADSGILFDGYGTKLSGSDFINGIDSLRSLGKVIIDDDVKTSFIITDQDSEVRFIKQLRMHLSAVEVIDLVDIAIDCGIVTDLTDAQHNFMSYKKSGNYYSALCFEKSGDESLESNRIFRFRLKGQDASSSDYSVTFDPQQNDIRSETEYANRASVFIDTLMKLVMAKYNVLIVHKAAMETDVQFPNPSVYDGYRELVCEYSDDDTPTESTQSQLKVLIRYKDTVKRTSFTANVIDDIFITFDELDRPRWGFSKITPGQSEPTPEPIHFGDSPEERARAAKEINNVRLVKQLSEQRDVKYTIFEELRRNENSNLYKLIKQREEIYRHSAVSDKDIPKVEFSLTPLTIYSNHIVSRTLKYRVVGQNSNVSTYYEYKFDPLSPRVSAHSVILNGRSYTLTESNRLVIMLEDGDPATTATYVPGCESISIRLSSVNPTYYPSNIYGDVFYIKSKCVPASQTGYAELNEGVLFYEDDLEPSALSRLGIKYLRRDMLKMPVGTRYLMDGYEDPVLNIVSDGQNKYAPKHCTERKCPTCGAAYYAADETWSKISEKYELTTGSHCCPECAGHIVNLDGKSFGVYALNSGANATYCVDDPENPQHIHVCSQCLDEGNDGLVYVGSDNTSHRCSICSEAVCESHSTVISGRVVCNLCASKDLREVTSFGSKGVNHISDVIWKKIRINFPTSSRKNLNYSLHGRWLRVYSMKGGAVQKTYIFVAHKNADSLSDNRFIFVKASSLNK